MKKASSVEDYISAHKQWKESLELLRELFLSSGMNETIKWGMPVYTVSNKNVAGFSAFKSHAGIWFFQGVFLKDPSKKLINAQEGVTKALRQWRFTSPEEIANNRETVIAYLAEAIQNQKEGREMKPVRKRRVEIPAELEKALSENPAFRDGFNALSPGKQKEYADYVRIARQEETRTSRLEKIIPMVMDGIGLNDKYKK